MGSAASMVAPNSNIKSKSLRLSKSQSNTTSTILLKSPSKNTARFELSPQSSTTNYEIDLPTDEKMLDEIKSDLKSKHRSSDTFEEEDDDKELLSRIASFCKVNKSNQHALNECIHDVVEVIHSSKAVTESLEAILYLSFCENDRKTIENFHTLATAHYNIKSIEDLGSHGACEIVVKLLKLFGVIDSKIAELGLWCIYCLAFSSVNRVKLDASGVCETVIDLLNIHGENSPSVVEVGFWAIYHLSFKNSLNKSKLGSDIGCEVVVEALKLHGKSSSSVSEAGFYAISNLVANDDINNAKLGECGACEIVIEMLKIHGKSNMNVAEAGCLAICNLAFLEDNRDKLGICKILIELCLTYRETNPTIKNCESIILMLQ